MCIQIHCKKMKGIRPTNLWASIHHTPTLKRNKPRPGEEYQLGERASLQLCSTCTTKQTKPHRKGICTAHDGMGPAVCAITTPQKPQPAEHMAPFRTLAARRPTAPGPSARGQGYRQPLEPLRHKEAQQLFQRLLPSCPQLSPLLRCRFSSQLGCWICCSHTPPPPDTRREVRKCAGSLACH